MLYHYEAYFLRVKNQGTERQVLVLALRRIREVPRTSWHFYGVLSTLSHILGSVLKEATTYSMPPPFNLYNAFIHCCISEQWVEDSEVKELTRY